MRAVRAVSAIKQAIAAVKRGTNLKEPTRVLLTARYAWERRSMNELTIAQGMADGTLPSPQQFMNSYYWLVRISQSWRCMEKWCR